MNSLLSDPFLIARYKSRFPDPGECLIKSIDWDNRRVSMSNGHCSYYPSFEEIKIVKKSVPSPGPFPHFHSGNEKQDVASLLDMAIDLVELWDTKESPYNATLRRCWMKRAQELGANISW